MLKRVVQVSLFLLAVLAFAQAQTNLAGTKVFGTALSCAGGGVSQGTFIEATAGYFGTPNSFPKAGDSTNVFVNYRILGSPCGTLEGVYTELFLPAGAEIVAAPQCFLNGSNVTNSNEFSCAVFNEASKFGGQVLGTNLLFGGQQFEVRVPVRFNQAVNSKIQFAVESASVSNFVGQSAPLVPEKSINVPYQAAVTYPNTATTAISNTSANLNAQVISNFKAGTAFFDFGTSPSYGSTSEALSIPSNGVAFNVSTPLQDLTPGTTYYWRLRFVTGGQTFVGANQSFTTTGQALPPIPEEFTLTVAKSGTGKGSLGSLPLGIACNPECVGELSSFPEGSSVKLYATPAEGSTFAGWSGACTGTVSPCTITMSSNQTVTASFNETTPDSFSLSVSKNGLGFVMSTPSGITCGSQCEAAFEDGTTISLVANAAEGFRFSGWSGDCVGTANCQVSMTQARNVTASFTALANETGSLELTISGLPTGAAAAVTLRGDNFSQRITKSTILENLKLGEYTLIAKTVSHNGNNYVPDQGTKGLSIGIDSPTLFELRYSEATNDAPDDQVTLNVAFEGNGSGSITSSPAGIDCITNCEASFDKDTVVTLNAVADENSSFTAWSGDCAGSATCTLTLSEAIMVIASFSSTQDPAPTPPNENQLDLRSNTLAQAPSNSLLNVPVLSFSAAAQGSESISVESLTIQTTGSGNDATDITAVKLFEDSNNNQIIDAADRLLGTASFNSDNGTTQLMLDETLELDPNSSSNLLVAVDLRSDLLLTSLTVLSALAAWGFFRRKKRAFVLSVLVLLSIILSSCQLSSAPQQNTQEQILSYQLFITEVSSSASNETGLPLQGNTLVINR